MKFNNNLINVSTTAVKNKILKKKDKLLTV